MTDITLFRGPLRLMLDDWDSTVRRYPNSILDSAVSTITQMGRLNNSCLAPPGGFAITPDGGYITPDIITGDSKGPDLFALVNLQATKLLISPKPNRSSFRTRAISSATGDVYRYLDALEAEIHRLENGDAMFLGYQSYFSWMAGTGGLPLGEILAEFKLGSPLWAATFTRDGLRVA